MRLTFSAGVRAPASRSRSVIPSRRWAVAVDFVGARRGVKPEGLDRTPATFSGWIVNNDRAEIMTVEGVGEDVERTARFIRRDGAILFASYLGTINAVPIGRLYDRGSEEVARDWRTLEALYPDVVRIDWSRKYPRPLMLRSVVTKFDAPPHVEEPSCPKC